MVRHQQRFAKNGLAVAMRNLGEQVVGLVPNKLSHRLEVVPEIRQALIPGKVIRRRVTDRPIAVRKVRRDVVGIPAEFQNVPLADSHVLNKTPGRMRNVGRFCTTEFNGYSCHRLVEVEVGTTSIEQDKGRVPLMQHRSSMASRSAQNLRVMVQEARQSEYVSGPNSFVFVGINSCSRSSIYKARRLQCEHERGFSISREPIEIDDVYTFTNARRAFAPTNNH